MEKDKLEQKEVNEKTTARIDLAYKVIKETQARIITNYSEQKSAKMNADTTQKHLKELTNIVENNKNDGNLKLLTTKENILKKFDDLDRFYSESLENMNDQID